MTFLRLLAGLLACSLASHANATAHFKVNTSDDLQFGSATQCTLRAALLNIAHQSVIGTLGFANPDCPAGQSTNVIEFTFPAGKSGHPEITLDPALGRLKLQGHEVMMSDITLDGESETGLLLIDGIGARLVLRDAILRNGVAAFTADPGGGCVFFRRGRGMSLVDVKIHDCVSAEFGGGIAIGAPGNFYFERVHLARSASRVGGGMFFFGGGRAFIVDSTIEDNLASEGAGIFADDSALSIEGSSLRSNSADQNGGAVYGGTLNARLVEFRDNVARGEGGAIFGGPKVQVDSASFAGNRSGVGGGAIVANGDLRVTRSGFDSNLSGERGGAVAIGKKAATHCVAIGNSTFAGNEAARAAALWVADVVFSHSCDADVGFVNNTFFANGGASQIELEDAGGKTDRDLLFANNLVMARSEQLPGVVNCVGRLERLQIVTAGAVRNAQFPGASCDTPFAKMPVVDLQWDGVTALVGGAFEQVYVPAAGIAFPLGDIAQCGSSLIGGVDQFGNARQCRQGAIEAGPGFELPRDYPPHD